MNSLHFSKDARQDLSGIKKYISGELGNPAAASKTLKKIMSSIRILREYAFAGPNLSAIADIPGGYRYLVCGNYIAFYRVSGCDIYIDRVLYGRRDYLKLLFGDDSSEN